MSSEPEGLRSDPRNDTDENYYIPAKRSRHVLEKLQNNNENNKDINRGSIDATSMINYFHNARQLIEAGKDLKDVFHDLDSNMICKIVSKKDADDYNMTLLHHAVIDNNENAIRDLISFGADVNAKDECDLSPLHFSVYLKNVDILKLLLENNAKANAKCNMGYNVLATSYISQNFEAAKYLLELQDGILFTEAKKSLGLPEQFDKAKFMSCMCFEDDVHETSCSDDED